ncbi:hypothetical protein SCP_0904050 [Sparassis crispa]|uniref:RED-like N-terminal domain-containing protein n=1 Tax=Sparassis crispa TaxID=139825 RepID=A0A401GWC6_9APHY|nr:hypothetical protein SCP_0904050 [Sparassis crispa]GBE86526.1 hypothetical protein SCP_0904050 [Sparassis crispa]
MDQDSFRKLLQTPGASIQHGSLLAAGTKSKQKVVNSVQPAFKPRTVKKKTEGPYRDRAAERRLGLDNDYAQVEALAEDFERNNAHNADREAVEEQRRYLGGDSAHSVLVKGLDYALLEQNRARESASTNAQDDDALERAFVEISEASSSGQKRTREEIVQALKNKRARVGKDANARPEKLPSSDVALEEAKKVGKFKPIGFKPIGSIAGEKAKKKVKQNTEALGEKGERKKKRKVDSNADEMLPPPPLPVPTPSADAGPSKPVVPSVPESGSEPIPEDFDIFADATEYTGIDLDEDEDSDSETQGKIKEEGRREFEEDEEQSVPFRREWFETEEDEQPPSPKPGVDHAVTTKPPLPNTSRFPTTGSPVPAVPEFEEGEEEETEAPVRLQPLASSALPSIRDFLALDSAADKAIKRRARKDKKREGGGQGGGAKDSKAEKDKLDRDYKRLKAYTDKKAAAGGDKR